MKDKLREFLDYCLHEAKAVPYPKDKHHYFDMAFGAVCFVSNHIDTDNFTELNEIWENEYYDKFRELGCLWG